MIWLHSQNNTSESQRNIGVTHLWAHNLFTDLKLKIIYTKLNIMRSGLSMLNPNQKNKIYLYKEKIRLYGEKLFLKLTVNNYLNKFKEKILKNPKRRIKDVNKVLENFVNKIRRSTRIFHKRKTNIHTNHKNYDNRDWIILHKISSKHLRVITASKASKVTAI